MLDSTNRPACPKPLAATPSYICHDPGCSSERLSDVGHVETAATSFHDAIVTWEECDECRRRIARAEEIAAESGDFEAALVIAHLEGLS